VVIATGSAPRVLAVPGEREYWGKGVTTCALCDAPFYKGKDVVVIGGGDSALEQALQLAPHARTVTLLVRKGSVRASVAMQQQAQACTNVLVTVNREIKEIKGNGTWVTEVLVHDMVTGTDTPLKIDGVFLAIGHEPRTALVKNKLKLRADGSIVVYGRSQATSVPGIFAAGDVEDSVYRQAGIAAGAGIKAAVEAAAFLHEHGWHAEVAQRLRAYFYQAADRGPSPVKLLTSRDMFDKEILNAQQPVIVDFYAQHCPSCMHMLPVYEAVARRFADRIMFYKVDTAAGSGLDERFKVERIPCFIVFKQGQQVARYYAVMSKPEMVTFVEQFAH
jgi:thioredoxin reductase (NADPH)